MGADVELHLNFRPTLQACDAAQDAFTEAVLADCTPNVPKRTGALRDSGHVSGKDEVTWSEDYADHVYSGTSRMEPRPWFETTKSEMLEDWARVVGEVLARD